MAERREKPSSGLFDDVLSLASKRLDALCEKSRREQAEKRLLQTLRRRRKTRGKHKLVSKPPQQISQRLVEAQERIKDEAYCLKEEAWSLGSKLTTSRDEGIEDAMRLQRQESLHSVEVFSYRLNNEANALLPHQNRLPCNSERPPGLDPDPMEVVDKDLEATVSQAEAFAEIRKMKHTMTPRVPQLHNRTLSGNIFDQSLGVLHDSRTSPELLDSEHAHLEIIGKEVSIWQEDSNETADTVRNRGRHASEDSDSGVGSGEARMSGEGGGGGGGSGVLEILASPEKYMDDTPGIGMEVICEEGGVDPNDVICHNGVMNGLSVGMPTDSELADLHQRSVVERAGQAERTSAAAEDLEGDMQFRILKIFQDSRYDLRFPVRRYSNQASRARTPVDGGDSKKQRLSPNLSASTRKRGRLRNSQTPSQSTSSHALKKKGRQKKNSTPTPAI